MKITVNAKEFGLKDKIEDLQTKLIQDAIDYCFEKGGDCIVGFGNANTYVSDCVLNSSCSAMRFGGQIFAL